MLSILEEAQLPTARHGAFSAGASGLTEPLLVLGVSAAGGVYPVTLMASALKSDFPVCSHLPVANTREPYQRNAWTHPERYG